MQLSWSLFLKQQPQRIWKVRVDRENNKVRRFINHSPNYMTVERDRETMIPSCNMSSIPRNGLQFY